MENFYALLIGVGGDLPVTSEDASALSALLSDPEKGGYLKENTLLMQNEKASKSEVLKALDFLIDQTKNTQNATVIIYYSGHGLQFAPEQNEKDFTYYLKTFGADLQNREETMLKGRDFSQKIAKINAKRLLVLLDCCHADGMGAKAISPLESMETSSSSNRVLMENLSKGEGRVFISACDDNEESVILPGSKNSLFTEVCLEVLNGLLSPSDEFVSMADLIYFVVKEVPKRVLPFRHVQRPIITEVQHLSPDYFICKNGNYHAPDIRLENYTENHFSERLSFIKNYSNTL